MADETSLFKIDLDNEEFLGKSEAAKAAIEAIGNVNNLAGLVQGLTAATLAIGTVGAAMYAIKEAFDLTLEAESIKQVNAQFEMLTEQAGIAGDTLKTALVSAAGGTVDETTLLKAANEAIVKMGSSASNIPQIMELARKATAVFGGDTISNFNNLSTAIAMGNARMLKHYGIVVDVAKVTHDYAQELGIADNELSENGKRQAISNAALAIASEKFKNVNLDIAQTKNAMATLGATITELKEIVVLAFDKVMGPSVHNFLTNLKLMADDAKTYFQDKFGQGTEQASAHLTRLNAKILETKAAILDIQAKAKQGIDFTPGDTQSRLATLQANLKAYEADLVKSKANVEALGEAEKKRASESAAVTKKKDSNVNEQEKLKDKAKFDEQMAALDTKYANNQKAMNTDLKKVNDILEAEKLAIHKKTLADIAKLDAQADLEPAQKAALTKKYKEIEQQEVKKVEESKRAEETKTIENFKKQNASASQEFANGFAGAAMSATQSLNDWSARGQAAAQMTTDALTEGFKAVGSGAGDMGDAIKRSILQALGARAIAEGSLLLLSGLWPPNPIAIGAGAGLIVLGGYLESQASKVGGGSSGITASASAGGGGTLPQTANSLNDQQANLNEQSKAAQDQQTAADAALAAAQAQAQQQTQAPQLPASQTQTARRQVTVQFQGDFLSTDQTRQRFLDLMRQETDATDFKYVQVGKG